MHYVHYIRSAQFTAVNSKVIKSPGCEQTGPTSAKQIKRVVGEIAALIFGVRIKRSRRFNAIHKKFHIPQCGRVVVNTSQMSPSLCPPSRKILATIFTGGNA